MRAGRLRHRVVLQSRTTAQNAYGEQVVSWTNTGTYWAAVEPVTGKERFASGERVHEQDVRVVMRYVGEIDTTQRISFDSKVYDIKAVINKDERNREYELLCSVGVSDG